MVCYTNRRNTPPISSFPTSKVADSSKLFSAIAALKYGAAEQRQAQLNSENIPPLSNKITNPLVIATDPVRPFSEVEEQEEDLELLIEQLGLGSLDSSDDEGIPQAPSASLFGDSKQRPLSVFSRTSSPIPDSAEPPFLLSMINAPQDPEEQRQIQELQLLSEQYLSNQDKIESLLEKKTKLLQKESSESPSFISDESGSHLITRAIQSLQAKQRMLMLKSWQLKNFVPQ